MKEQNDRKDNYCFLNYCQVYVLSDSMIGPTKGKNNKLIRVISIKTYFLLLYNLIQFSVKVTAVFRIHGL